MLIALKGTNATQVALAAGLSPNTLSKFTSQNSKAQALTEKTLTAVLPVLGLSSAEELDTDNPLTVDPRLEIRRHLDLIPDADMPALLAELQRRFPVSE